MNQKKHTTAQRLAKLENVQFQTWAMCKMLQKEVGILQKKLNIEIQSDGESDESEQNL